MNAAVEAVQSNAQRPINTARYARCISASKRARWDIDADVIRGRQFDLSQRFLPNGLSKVDELPFLSSAEARLLTQVQGRTYAQIFGLVERFINAKVLEISRDHWFQDQTALHALIRFSDEELKHQELFRRVEEMIGAIMPPGYRAAAEPNDVAQFVLGKSTWAVLCLTSLIELFSQQHYLESIAPQTTDISPLWKDVFMYHWKEECQHAMLDELEWQREHAKLDTAQRDRAVNDVIDLVAGVDMILQGQAAADVEYFVAIAGRRFSEGERQALDAGVLKAYRWQYIVSGVQHAHFGRLLTSMTTPEQLGRIQKALTPILQA
ncbi:MAG TPA: hypothetical protein VEZ88_01735 [Steroidobacteraceae bacterium]|nr:hypothetical protein [Steroidobacteraceae bacterium]